MEEIGYMLLSNLNLRFFALKNLYSSLCLSLPKYVYRPFQTDSFIKAVYDLYGATHENILYVQESAELESTLTTITSAA